MQRFYKFGVSRKARVIAMCGLAICGLLLLTGCKKKPVATAPPPPPAAKPEPPSAPSAPPLAERTFTPRIDSFTVEPTRIERGQSVTLRWATTDAETVTIDQGLGTMPSEGTRQLFPGATTTYVMIARTGNASDTRSVTVEVTAAGPLTTAAAKTADPGVPALIGQLQDIYFDYDMSEFRDDARRALNTDADLLKRILAADSQVNFVIEGHADERGSAEYNLGLADRRAIVTRDGLVQLGVSANRLRTISYGEEAPVCREMTEECWQRNRRAHLTAVR